MGGAVVYGYVVAVVHGYPAVNEFGWGRSIVGCGYLVVGVVRDYPAVNEFGWGRSIVGCGYQVVGVVHGCLAVNNELGQGRTTVVCCYRVVGDSCAKAGQYPYSSTLVKRNHKVGSSS